MNEDYKILVAPDHPTPLALKTHTSDPVPFMIYTHKVGKAENQEKYYREHYSQDYADETYACDYGYDAFFAEFFLLSFWLIVFLFFRFLFVVLYFGRKTKTTAWHTAKKTQKRRVFLMRRAQS